MILQKAVELRDGRTLDVSSDILAQKLSSYAGLLAGQGNLSTALVYLSNSNEVRNGHFLVIGLNRSLGETL